MKTLLIILISFTLSYFENQFSPKLAKDLESIYGPGMMSAGEEHSIDRMLESIEINDKKILDFGSGLGGPAFYLAQKYGAEVIGIDSNLWLTEYANNNVPQEISDRVHFVYQENGIPLPFQDAVFDLIYCKEVLTHIEFKDNYFKEFRRVLKTGKLIIITDWLSSTLEWGENMNSFLTSQNAQMYPMTLDNYLELLESNHYEVIDVRIENDAYISYYLEILEKIHSSYELRSAYQSIFNALKSNELQITKIVARTIQ